MAYRNLPCGAAADVVSFDIVLYQANALAQSTGERWTVRGRRQGRYIVACDEIVTWWEYYATPAYR